MKIYNCHSHSKYSHDGEGSIEEIVASAVKYGLAGIVISDHCDCEYCNDKIMNKNLLNSYTDTKNSAEKYKNELQIFTGIEIGDALFAPEFAKEIIASKNRDVILGSVHAVRIKGIDIPFSLIDFSTFTDSEIEIYTKQYFSDVLQTAEETEYDILCHLTVLMRYIKYKYKRNISLKDNMDLIEEILKTVIKRNKTLEINVSGYNDGYLMPDKDIISLYKSLGGKKISLGNDSHRPEGIGAGINESVILLKEAGVDSLVYYKNRKPVMYNI